MTAAGDTDIVFESRLQAGIQIQIHRAMPPQVRADITLDAQTREEKRLDLCVQLYYMQ